MRNNIRLVVVGTDLVEIHEVYFALRQAFVRQIKLAQAWRDDSQMHAHHMNKASRLRKKTVSLRCYYLSVVYGGAFRA